MAAETRREGLNQPADHRPICPGEKVGTLAEREEPQHEAVPSNAQSRPKKPKARKTKSIPGRTPEAVAKAMPEAAMKGLTEKQQLFVRNYLVDLNATQAAIRAGYSENCASEIGYENLRKPQIMAAIDSALRELGGITRLRIVDELGAIAFSDITDIVNWDDDALDIQPGDAVMIDGDEVEASKEGITRIFRSKVRIAPSAAMAPSISRAIAEVSQTDSNSLKVKLHDKIAALDKLARALGMYQKIDDVGSKNSSMVATIIYEGRTDVPSGSDRDESG
jgi:phage terminase small subunit